MWRMRAASPASCTCMPKSTKLATICACACAWLSPPITPNDTHGLPSLHDHRRHQRVQRTLVRADLIRMPGRQGEAGAAVVQRDAGLAGDEAGAKARKQRLNERDHVALAVSGSQVDRVAAILA